MQKEIELKCLCDGLLDALREMGLGKYSLRNYYDAYSEYHYGIF